MTRSAFVSSRWGAVVCVLAGLLVAGALSSLGATAVTASGVGGGLPAGVESRTVAELQQRLPDADTTSALVVYSRAASALTVADRGAITADVAALARTALDGRVAPAVFSDDGRTALVAVPLSAAGGYDPVSAAVRAIRAQARSGAPSGLVAQVTGPAAFTTDIAASFDGANTRLILVTVAVVALLLLITYRSPFLWLVPLAVVALSAGTAMAVFALVSRATGLVIDPSTSGIADVLVFGAGTDYALLLIARYREELRGEADRRLAMARAWRSAGPAIAASAGCVVLALLVLSLAQLQSDRALGYVGAMGIAVAALFALLVLPGALVLCGRRLFWPFVPRLGSVEGSRTGPWSRVARRVTARPWPVVAGCVVVLAVLSLGVVGVRVGLSQTEQFRVRADSVDALETLATAFPAGAADPVVVLARTSDPGPVVAAVTAVRGVASASVSQVAGGLVQVDAVLDAAPGTTASYATIERMRTQLDGAPGDPLVGGSTATDLDTRTAAERDLRVVAPVVLLVVLLVLVVLLRSLVGPLVLILSVVASFFAALGASTWVFTHVLGFPALDTGVPLLSFLFLVALGVDYSIFLVTRAREEALHSGTRAGIVTAVAVTGAVITSAGVLLAAVFAVLGVLPLITLTEIGVIVGFGVLLDTLLVRTVLVPAVITLLDRWFWWPSALSRR